ncbi:PR-1-like protein, partial [Cylindrobasidium torrendii FP15055 ss-10]
AKYGASSLTWNPSLYAATLAWAQACNFQHSTPNGAYGENLAASTSSTYNVQNAVTDWMGEAAQYNYNSPGFSSATGHFTQVVWKGTTQVACAVASCAADKIFPGRTSQYVVCRYTPPGNYNNQFAYVSFPSPIGI